MSTTKINVRAGRAEDAPADESTDFSADAHAVVSLMVAGRELTFYKWKIDGFI